MAFGAETAKWICVGAIDITQISVAGTAFMFVLTIHLSKSIRIVSSISIMVSQKSKLMATHVRIELLQVICLGMVNHIMLWHCSHL